MDATHSTTNVEDATTTHPAAEVRLHPKELRRSYGRLRLASEESLDRMRASLRLHGQQTALVVMEAEEGYELLDGFKRTRVAHEVPGLKSLRCQVVGLDPRAAKIAMVNLNRPSSGLTEMEEAWIIRALVREDGLSQLQVAGRMGKERSWVCRRLALAEKLAPLAQEAVRRGELSPTAARNLVQLPRGNQLQVLEAAKSHQLSVREVGGLVKLLLEKTSPRIQEAILRAPRNALAGQERTRKMRGKEKAETTPASRLARRIGLLENVGRSVGREIRTEMNQDPARQAVLAREGPGLARRLTWLLSCLPKSWAPSFHPSPAEQRSATKSPTSSTPRDGPNEG